MRTIATLDVHALTHATLVAENGLYVSWGTDLVYSPTDAAALLCGGACVCVYVCVRACVRVCVCVCVCVYVWHVILYMCVTLFVVCMFSYASMRS